MTLAFIFHNLQLRRFQVWLNCLDTFFGTAGIILSIIKNDVIIFVSFNRLVRRLINPKKTRLDRVFIINAREQIVSQGDVSHSNVTPLGHFAPK